jgi:DNA-directed RNA polymerase subunit RPC12/RpoP
MDDNKKYRCVDCLSLFDDSQLESDMLFCPSCGGHLDEGTFKSSSTTEEDRQDKQQYRAASHLLFECLSCSKIVRLAFPFKSSGFRCPKCNDMYDIHTLSAPSPVFVITPRFKRKESNDPPPQPEMPDNVKAAMQIFGMNASASLAEIKTSYRKCMSEYHPDKVMHLGLDLRKLAETKTKEYNLAFETIQRYFQGRSSHKSNGTNET